MQRIGCSTKVMEAVLSTGIESSDIHGVAACVATGFPSFFHWWSVLVELIKPMDVIVHEKGIRATILSRICGRLWSIMQRTTVQNLSIPSTPWRYGATSASKLHAFWTSLPRKA